MPGALITGAHSRATTAPHHVSASRAIASSQQSRRAGQVRAEPSLESPRRPSSSSAISSTTSSTTSTLHTLYTLHTLHTLHVLQGGGARTHADTRSTPSSRRGPLPLTSRVAASLRRLESAPGARSAGLSARSSPHPRRIPRRSSPLEEGSSDDALAHAHPRNASECKSLGPRALLCVQVLRREAAFRTEAFRTHSPPSFQPSQNSLYRECACPLHRCISPDPRAMTS
jgi:hypothetical protein